MTLLEEVINPKAEPAQAPPETGRLSAAQVLIAVAQIGGALEKAAQAFQKIPDATPNGLDNLLDDLILAARAMLVKAERLKQANK